MITLPLVIYVLASVAAGIVNTLAGGGSFLTFPALLMTGLDARAANITSTLALYPVQLTTGYAGRELRSGTDNVSFRALFTVSFIGGVIGAILLVQTSAAFFSHLVPWFILFATAMFAWSAFFKKKKAETAQHHIGKSATLAIQFLIGIYGGYFGAGIGILMMAALSLAGMAIKKATVTKTVLASGMNGAAVLIFLFTPDVAWVQVVLGAVASVIGGQIGMKLLHKVNEKYLRIFIIVWGLVLSISFFLKD